MQPAYPPPKVTSDSKVACFHDLCTNPAKTGCPFCFPCCWSSGGYKKPICESHFSPEALAHREAMILLVRGERGHRRRGGNARRMQQTQQLEDEEAVDPQAASEAASSSTSTGPRPPKNPPPQHLLEQNQKRALRTPSRSPPWRRRRS